jgi:outer membrane protein assembly factor BamB
VPQVIFFLVSLFLAESLAGEEAATARWPRFRGPNGSGIADSDKPPIEFGPSTKLLWKCALPPGHSSPIVWDDHIFLTGIENERLVVIAVGRRDGKLLWKQTIPETTIEVVHPFSSAAASTPVTDGEHVYAYFASYGLLAYDFNGKEIWRRPLPLPPTQYGASSGVDPVF